MAVTDERPIDPLLQQQLRCRCKSNLPGRPLVFRVVRLASVKASSNPNTVTFKIAELQAHDFPWTHALPSCEAKNNVLPDSQSLGDDHQMFRIQDLAFTSWSTIPRR